MTRSFAFKSATVLGALFVAASLAAGPADARIGGGGSMGSRGGRTFQTAPTTPTAPRSAAPITRSEGPQYQPSAPGAAPFQRPSFGSRFGTGLAAGLLGAGLFGLLTGSGFFGGIGGLLSFFGFLLQIGLIVAIGALVVRWFRGRNQPNLAFAGAGGPAPRAPQPDSFARNAASAPGGSRLEVAPADFNVFERVLGEINAAYGREDRTTLRRLATPEMARYFEEELAANERKGVVNRTSGATLLQGDLAEAWREGAADYASVAMRFSLIDATVERGSGRVVDGSLDRPQEVTEVWTFRRDRGADWVLTAIQQV